MNVDGNFFYFVIFHIDQQIILKSATRIVEHSYHYLLGLLFVERSRCRLTENAYALVVAEMNFLRFV